MKRLVSAPLTLVAAMIAIAGCTDSAMAPGDASRPSFSLSSAEGEGAAATWVLMSSSGRLRPGMVAEVQRAGGTVESALDGIGVMVATSADPAFESRAAAISGISDVVRDQQVQWIDPVVGEEAEAAEAGADPQSHGGVGAHETFRMLQWAPEAVSAPAAWAAGHQGAGARVAILDGALNSNHIDIAPNLDAARSRSFVPQSIPLWEYNRDVGAFWHGTHVAGIVAAPANGVGTVGIAPRATLIGVKVLHGGRGAFSWIINGIYYAATPIAEGGAGADIINMSLAGTFPRQGARLARLAVAVSRATQYATQRGVTVIAAAANSALDLDHTANLIVVPAQSVGVIAVSATGPKGWAVPGATWSLDRPASYTNFGQSAIALAGPGGDFALGGTALCTKPRLDGGLPLVRPCWVFDMVMAPFGAANNSFGWAAGTSMASPAAAGVAALIVGQAKSMGESLTPAQVRTRLERSADDLGKPGNDDYYGAGRVNAARAVQQ